jgi:hypothetical protein
MTSILFSLILFAGADQPRTSVMIQPAKLLSIACDSATVVPAKPLKCNVLLDRLASRPITIPLTTSLPVLSVPSTVTVGQDADKATFDAKATPLAQSASVLISANYGGTAKSVSVTVLPVALEAIAIVPNNSTTGGGMVHGEAIPMLSVTLTAPPPPGGLKVKLSAQVTASHGGGLPVMLPESVMQKNQTEQFEIKTRPVASETWVAINASSDFFNHTDTKSVTLDVKPATLRAFVPSSRHASHVPLGGETMKWYIELVGLAPPGGAALDLQYSGDTPILGPSKVVIPANQNVGWFNVTASPCSVKTTCTSTITARYLGAQVSASITIDQ